MLQPEGLSRIELGVQVDGQLTIDLKLDSKSVSALYLPLGGKMNRLILVSIFILLWPLAGFAQEVPKNEISGGFSELRETQPDKPRYSPGFYVSYARNLN